jgi:hypothetical protein
VESNLQRRAPRRDWDAEHAAAAAWLDAPPSEMIQLGSGWGALENLLRAADGRSAIGGPGAPFPAESIGDQQQAWLSLLRSDAFPNPDPAAAPLGFVVQPEWRARMESAVANAERDNWFAWLHAGVMRAYAGDADGAAAAWHRSHELRSNGWALRNLAHQAHDGELYRAAHALLPEVRTLTIEACRMLWSSGKSQDCLDLIDALPATERSIGRIRLYEGLAALAAGRLERVKVVLDTNFVVDDLREGDTPLSDLWFGYHEQRIASETGAPVDDALRERVRHEHPLPRHYDFRMTDT